jgi:hypothetical protein
VCHAHRHIVSAESGNILIWSRLMERVLYKEEQPCVRQLTLLDGGQRLMAISRPSDSGADVTRINATIVTRTMPGKPLQLAPCGTPVQHRPIYSLICKT